MRSSFLLQPDGISPAGYRHKNWTFIPASLSAYLPRQISADSIFPEHKRSCLFSLDEETDSA